MRANRVEALERRRLMDGDVSASFEGGNLSITGDKDDNHVRIMQSAAGTLRVEGLDETTVNGEDFVEFAGSLRDARVNTRQDGEDHVEIQGPLQIGRDVVARLGAGSLAIEGSSGPLEIAGDLIVRPGGEGNVELRNQVIVSGDSRIHTGAQFTAISRFGGLPDFDASAFSDPLGVDNPYFPLIPGTTYTYEETSVDEETGETVAERVVVDVTNDTKQVFGVTTRVLRDRVFVDGVLVEDTFDWHAQDHNGNVWYFGEESTDFEYDDGGNLIGTSTAMSWEAGVDGAMPGIIMQAAPTVGDVYYQEFQPGVALDQGEVLATGETLETQIGRFDGVLRTEDVSVLSPDALENKFYAPGLGLVGEVHLDPLSGEVDTTLRLVSVELNGDDVTQVVPTAGFQGTNVPIGDGPGPIEFFGEMSATSQESVVVREARFADDALLYSRADIAVTDALFDDELYIFARGSAGISNSSVADHLLLRAGGDAYVFDSQFAEVRLSLGTGDDELVIGNSMFEALFADGGRGMNTLEDEGDNDFGDRSFRRFAEEE